LLAIVTFDLHGAHSKDYADLKMALSKIGLEPHIDKAGDSALLRLPDNTYAGKLKGTKKDAVGTMKSYGEMLGRKLRDFT
jgi:hypothetical protein